MYTSRKGGGVGALAQGPPEKAQPIQWIVLGKPSRAFSPGVECLGNLIMKGRKLALRHLGSEPARIYLPFCKQLSVQSVAMSEYLAIALVGFGGEVRYATKPPWTQMLAIVNIDLPRKIIDRPQRGPTVFTDASSATSTAAVVWQSEGEWHCIKMTDCALSVQQLEATALVLACGLFPMEHLNIVTDSMFVAKLCLAMSGPGVSTSTAVLMLEEALFSRKDAISVMRYQSHKATIQHWLTVMAWLGIPNQIKTDNGLNFVSKSVQTCALKWGITLTHGIPYNSTGQAIVERANQTLKSKLEVLAKTEGFANAVPPGDQTRLLATALLALNQFPRGEEVNSPTQKHWATRALEEGPLVIIRNELGEWEQGWRLVLTGRGYAAIKKDGKVKWCPLKSIKPDLQIKTNENCEFLFTGPNHRTPS